MKLSRNYYHGRRVILNWLVALASMVRYGWPQRGMTLLAVTGTDGKTTTVQLLASILRQTGQPVGVISTVGATIDGEVLPLAAHVSTPGPRQVYYLLHLMHRAGVKWVVVETTSHGLDQHRVAGLRFAVGAITNISPEHLDYHLTMERYVAAKARLISLCRTMVLNDADDRLRPLEKRCKRLVRFGTEQSEMCGSQVMPHDDGVEFLLHMGQSILPVRLYLPGMHNVLNAQAAAAMAQVVGIAPEMIVEGLADVRAVAGRWQVVQRQPFWVIVDFAHTPQAFAQVLPLAKQLAGQGRVLHVFGSAGGRDAQKRHQMGQLSGRYADVSIVTMEDPRRESLETIQQQLLDGVRSAANKVDWQRIDNRREAIGWAINQAKAGDVVLLTGKGHETSMNIGGQEEPWDEVAEAQTAIARAHA